VDFMIVASGEDLQQAHTVDDGTCPRYPDNYTFQAILPAYS
jgi:hypothetical protein